MKCNRAEDGIDMARQKPKECDLCRRKETCVAWDGRKAIYACDNHLLLLDVFGIWEREEVNQDETEADK